MDRKKSVITNFIWRFAERCGAQGVTLIVSIVLARLLDPEDFGIVALVSVFTLILQTFVESGFGTALIQKKDADDLDFSSVFYAQVMICIVLYALMFFAAPLIARIYTKYDAALLTSLLRVMSLIILVSGVKNVQQAYVSRTMQFKRFFFATLGGTVGAAVLGIWMAYHGYGVWALVAQNLFNQTVDTIILWITVKWRPRWMFSWQRLKTLFSYGWKMLASGLIDRVFTKLRQLVIGGMYSPADLAFYEQGEKYPHAVMDNINSSLDSVLLPTLSRSQDHVEEVRDMTRRVITTGVYILAPLMVGLAACSETVIRLLLTDKWLPCVPYLRIFCITYLFAPIHTANLNAIKALGRSDLFLKLEIIKKAVGFAILLVAIQYGVMAIAYSLLLQSLCGQIINTWPNRKLLRYSYLQQLRDILPALLLSLVMGAAVYAIGKLPIALLSKMLLQIIAGAAVYIGLSALLKNETFHYLWTIVQPAVRHVFKRKS